MAEGTVFTNYFDNLSAMPGNMVVPPLRTMFSYRLFLISISDSMMELYNSSGKLFISFPIIIGLNSASGHLNFWLPRVITFPSGN